ncbi:hypothetical protein PHK61_30540 [Actinomycetospora lutea]|uniref:hypothetical protein n=1 Tax=Actinomycetospora lutea TaxID=663604 RepID=UPI0023654204|nr:hypothetical protein [Actinomycetospora lutea]MDD7942761.1 hypothetical protein [Actinomycetospora lutea]
MVLLLLGANPRLTSVAWALVAFGTVGLVAATLVGIVRRELRHEATRLVDTVAQGILEVLPPAEILGPLLDRVYGPSEHNRAILTSVLGGAGLATDGSDLTISEHTDVVCRLNRVDDVYFQLVMEVDYAFRRRVPASTFVFFATSDPVLRDSIVVGSTQSLFELWFVSDDAKTPVFDDSVESMRASVRLGMTYVDGDNDRHEITDVAPALREIHSPDWPKYLSFFRGGTAGGTQLDHRHYLAKLRMFEVDLSTLVTPGTHSYRILGIHVRSTTLQLLDNRSCFWHPPYPCFVRTIGFDTSGLDVGTPQDELFRVHPFTSRSDAGPLRWVSSDEVRRVELNTWCVPGNGVHFMWREEHTCSVPPADQHGRDRTHDNQLPPGMR